MMQKVQEYKELDYKSKTMQLNNFLKTFNKAIQASQNIDKILETSTKVTKVVLNHIHQMNEDLQKEFHVLVKELMSDRHKYSSFETKR